MHGFRLFACLLLLLGLGHAQAATLSLDLGNGPSQRDSASLLADPATRTIEISHDVAYGRPMRYRALPLAELLKGVAADAQVQFVASDGFVAELAAAPLLATRGARAWLAVEDPVAPWPLLGGGKAGSAGPFYLVWTDPAAAGITPEQWPYQVAAIRLVDDLGRRFPALLPDAGVPQDSPARRGFAVFRQHCLTCHTLNRQGGAQLGPDLNQPHGPLEYFGEAMLRAYIRDPQSLRYWPQARMPAFDAQVLPEADLDALLAYLRQMQQQRGSP